MSRLFVKYFSISCARRSFVIERAAVSECRSIQLIEFNTHDWAVNGQETGGKRFGLPVGIGGTVEADER